MPLTNAFRDYVVNGIVNPSTMTPFNSANAHLGVGDGTTAFSASQVDLTGTNKVRKPMNSGYPQVSAPTITFAAAFSGSEANFTWNEWGIFNASSGGVMMLRTVENLGTKSSGAVWELVVSITFAV